MAVYDVSWHGPKIIHHFTGIRHREMSLEVVEKTLLILQENPIDFHLELVAAVPRWMFLVCCLSIATRQSGDDVHDLGGCHLRCWRSLFSEYCVRTWIVFHNITAENNSTFVFLVLCASNSAFFRWQMSISEAKWTFAPFVLVSSITSESLLTFVRSHAGIFSYQECLDYTRLINRSSRNGSTRSLWRTRFFAKRISIDLLRTVHVSSILHVIRSSRTFTN